MKKIMSFFIFTTLVLILTGCNSTTEDTYNSDHADNDPITEEYYIPSGVEFRVFKGSNRDNEIDVSEYFDVSFSCTGLSVWDNCFGANLGKSVESSGLELFYGSKMVNFIVEPKVNTISMDLTFYALKGEDLDIYSTFLLESEDGDIKRESQIGTDFESGVSLFGTVMGKKEDGTVYLVEYTFNYVTIDQLELVTVKQFDHDDNLLVETTISSDDLLSSITLNQNTEYYFVIEDYMTLDGTQYQERIYSDTSTTLSYLYKYTNEQGFLNGDKLIIN
jgi:hypothetical protein